LRTNLKKSANRQSAPQGTEFVQAFFALWIIFDGVKITYVLFNWNFNFVL
jgi:hypothetical protein